MTDAGAGELVAPDEVVVGRVIGRGGLGREDAVQLDDAGDGRVVGGEFDESAERGRAVVRRRRARVRASAGRVDRARPPAARSCSGSGAAGLPRSCRPCWRRRGASRNDSRTRRTPRGRRRGSPCASRRSSRTRRAACACAGVTWCPSSSSPYRRRPRSSASSALSAILSDFDNKNLAIARNLFQKPSDHSDLVLASRLPAIRSGIAPTKRTRR